jgi:hypothetical protein
MNDTPDGDIAALQSDAGFVADWSGENGRAAQVAAVERKSALHEAAYGGEQETVEPIMSEQVAEGLQAEDSVTQEAAAAMIPAQDMSEYHFNWQGQGDMELGQLADMNTVASEAAFALGANPHYARQTIEFIDQQLSRPDMAGASADDVIETLNARHGMQAKATVDAARAAVERMPESARQWLFDAMDGLDANSHAWVVNRLASIHRANQ